MNRLVIFQILFSLVQSSSLWECPSNKTISLMPHKYSKLPVIKSTLPRSQLTSNLLNYDWADISPEIEVLLDIYPPLADVSASMPDYLPPNFVLDALEIVAHNRSSPNSYEIHQYTKHNGHPRLLNILALFSSYLMKRRINANKELLVTIGASNALDLAARAFLNSGEEVIVFEPVYIMLKTAIMNARGVPIYVPLRVRRGTTGKNSNDWTFDPREFESKISPKTKMIMINNPLNPNGKSFTMDELNFIGYLAEKYNLVIVSDEAGLWWQYNKPGHIHIASLPGLFKRTITIISGGKMFSKTGWKIGWIVAAEDMLWGINAISSNSIFTVAMPLQIAYAMALEKEFPKYNSPDSYWKKLNEMSLKTRDKLIWILNSIGADYIVPSAGYCLLADFTRLANQIDLSSETDCRPGMRFFKFLLKKGIAVNPTSIYYSPHNMWRTEYLVRLTNVKTEKTIDEFGRLLASIFRTSTV